MFVCITLSISFCRSGYGEVCQKGFGTAIINRRPGISLDNYYMTQNTRKGENGLDDSMACKQ